MNDLSQGITLDANTVCRILGFSCETNLPVPRPIPNEVIVYYENAWTMETLRGSRMGHRMRSDGSYDLEDLQLPPSYARLLIPVTGPPKPDWREHLQALVQVRRKPVPACILAVAQLVYRELYGSFIFTEGARCADALDEGYHAGLEVYEDLLCECLPHDGGKYDDPMVIVGYAPHAES